MMLGSFTRSEMCDWIRARELALNVTLTASDIVQEHGIPVRSRDLFNLHQVIPSYSDYWNRGLISIATKATSLHGTYIKTCIEAGKREGIVLEISQRRMCAYRKLQREWTRRFIAAASPFMLKVLQCLFARIFDHISSIWNLPAEVPHLAASTGEGPAGGGG
jgi:hypothetical protein